MTGVFFLKRCSEAQCCSITASLMAALPDSCGGINSEELKKKKHPTIIWNLFPSSLMSPKAGQLNSGAGFVNEWQWRGLGLKGRVPPSVAWEGRKDICSSVQPLCLYTPKVQEVQHEIWQSEVILLCRGKARHLQHRQGLWSLLPSPCSWMVAQPSSTVAKGAESGMGRSSSEGEEIPNLNFCT